MDYSLAKQLKEEGFPQHKIREEDCNQWCHHAGNWLCEKEGHQNACAPTLEELIEACQEIEKDTLELSIMENGRCFAGFRGGEDYQGSTPIEAIARLWLALQK